MATSSGQRAKSAFDTLLLWLAIAIVLASMVGYYYFTQYAEVIRVIGMLCGAGLGILVASQTSYGKTAWGYIQGSRSELRRMVWPNRRETVQTTLMVVLFVLLLAAFIWVLDIILGNVVSMLTGRA